jgi:hypothetical protein
MTKHLGKLEDEASLQVTEVGCPKNPAMHVASQPRYKKSRS